MSQIKIIKIKKEKKNRLKECAKRRNKTMSEMIFYHFRKLLIESGLPTI